MMDRKEAIRAYKERKPQRGVYAIRCVKTGSVWVGSCQDLTAAENRNWFQLRQRVHNDRVMQEEWDLYGASEFKYEVLERFDEDLPALSVADVLKERRSAWMEKLDSAPEGVRGRTRRLL